MPGSSRVVAPVAMIALSNEIRRVPPALRATSIVWSSVNVPQPSNSVDAVLLHQEVDALDAAVGDLAAAAEGDAVVEPDRAVDADAEGLRLVREQVRQLGVAQQRLGRDAADVEAHAAPVLVLDHGDAEAELSGADGGDVPAGTGTEDDDVEGIAHPSTLTRAPV